MARRLGPGYGFFLVFVFVVLTAVLADQQEEAEHQQDEAEQDGDQRNNVLNQGDLIVRRLRRVDGRGNALWRRRERALQQNQMRSLRYSG